MSLHGDYNVSVQCNGIVRASQQARIYVAYAMITRCKCCNQLKSSAASAHHCRLLRTRSFIRYVLSVLRLRLFCTLLYVQVMRVIAINVCVQYNGGLLPDIILLFDPMLFPSGNPFKEGLGAF